VRGDARSMRVLTPRTVREALDAYASHADAVPLAGGTDFMVAWNEGRENARTILDLSRVAPWRRIRERADGLRVGALVTHWQLQHHPVVTKRFPLLADACATVGVTAIKVPRPMIITGIHTAPPTATAARSDAPSRPAMIVSVTCIPIWMRLLTTIGPPSAAMALASLTTLMVP